ncbi:MAG: TraR/DksA family transcriptional regulator [Acidimicrobiales bacterium]
MSKVGGAQGVGGAEGRASKPAASGAVGKAGVSAKAEREGKAATPTKATAESQDQNPTSTSASRQIQVTVEKDTGSKVTSATKKESAVPRATAKRVPAKKAQMPKAAGPTPKAPEKSTLAKGTPADVVPTERGKAVDPEVSAARLTKSASVVSDPTVAERKPPVYVPLPVDVYDAKFLAEQSELLVAEQVAYTESAAELKAEADALAQDMEPGDVQFDEESGEGGTATIDRERDLVLSAQARAAVDEITHALVKIGTRTYGSCENCRQPIPKARLKALPYARLCVACKSGGLSRR